MVNHQKRRTGDTEASLILSRSNSLGFESKMVSINNTSSYTLGSEKYLRLKRYNSLWELMSKSDRCILVTAHTKSDIVESYVMYLLGWGGRGWGSSIPVIRRIESGYIIRPFIRLTRYQVSNSLSLISTLNCFQDISNFSDEYKRSFVRNNIVTSLFKLDKNIEERFFYLANYSYSMNNYFNKKNISFKKKIVIPLYVVNPKFLAKRIMDQVSSILKRKESLEKYKKILDSMLNFSYKLRVLRYRFSDIVYTKVRLNCVNIKILSRSLVFEEI